MRKAFKVISVLLIASVFVLTSRVPPNQVVAATVSPTPMGGGGKVAFTSDRDGHEEIYVMDADGSNQHRLTYSEKGMASSQPAWSHDGWQIAFTYGDPDNGIAYVYVMGANGGNPHRISKGEDNDYNPVWSPDGKYIAFISRRQNNPWLFEMDTNGDNVTYLDGAMETGNPDYSPDGKSIVDHIWGGGTPNIDLVDFDASHKAGDAKPLTNSNLDYSTGFQKIHDHEDSNPAWSPNSRYIAFVSSRKSNICPGVPQVCLYIMNRAGSQTRGISLANKDIDLTIPPESYWQHLSWSPDSQHLVFTARSVKDDKVPFNIWIISIDGTNNLQLTSNAGNNFQPAWQPVR